MREPGWYWVRSIWGWHVEKWLARGEWSDNSFKPSNFDSDFLEIDERRIVRQEP